MALSDLYINRFRGFNVKHFYSWYRRDNQGSRSYTWVKNTLQQKGLVPKSAIKGTHRKKRTRATYAGMMLHQDGSLHQWIAGKYWDLIVTMDDVSSEHYSMFFVEEEVTHKQLPVEKRCYWATRWGVGEDDDNSKQPIRGVRNARQFFKSYSSTRKHFIPSDYCPKR